jgi:flavin prenyltransferase
MDAQTNSRIEQGLVVAITGASGAPYAKALIHSVAAAGIPLYLVASSAGKLVYEIEMGTPLEADLPPSIHLHRENDFTAPFASGSFPILGMVVVPCTMGTLGAIANGLSQNLIHRAADVCLKEGRKLVIVPRETPLNQIHLTNMLRLSQAGGIILPAMPGFYHRPQSLEELVHFIVARILDQFGIPQTLVAPWSGFPSPR